jgi:hypothetical protein
MGKVTELIAKPPVSAAVALGLLLGAAVPLPFH